MSDPIFDELIAIEIHFTLKELRCLMKLLGEPETETEKAILFRIQERIAGYETWMQYHQSRTEEDTRCRNHE